MPKKYMKLSPFFIVLLSAIFLVGLPPTATGDSTDTRILTTFFPIYLFTLNLTQNIPGLQVDILLPSDYGCPHDFSLAPEDIKKIHQADFIIINGLGLDDFIEDILSGKENSRLLNATAMIVPLPSRSIHIHRGHPDDSADISNPHPFASPVQAQLMIAQIASTLASLLPLYSDKIMANAAGYQSRLDSLDAEFRTGLQNLSNPRAAAGHEIYDYLARDYGFKIIDVIEKEPGQEPSAKETITLAKNLRAAKIAAIFSQPQYSDRMARTLGEELSVPVYPLDPLATGPAHPPLDYYETTMRKNLQNLLKAMK
jgi:ABC-type Zn uptake system ZnuABC Zn-binding protein ZnuA